MKVISGKQYISNIGAIVVALMDSPVQSSTFKGKVIKLSNVNNERFKMGETRDTFRKSAFKLIS